MHAHICTIVIDFHHAKSLKMHAVRSYLKVHEFSQFKFIFSTCIFRVKISYLEMNSIVINMIEKLDWHLPLLFVFFVF